MADSLPPTEAVETRPHTHMDYDFDPCTPDCPAHPSYAALPRLRIKRGRVMHAVKVSGRDAYAPLCGRRTRTHRLDWSATRYDYPDCPHCLVEESR